MPPSSTGRATLAASAQATSERPRARAGFVQARIGSAVAIVPLGVWTIVHLWNNLSAFQGAEAWQRAVTEYPHPIAEAATGVLVLLPLALHTIWGIGRLASIRPNNLRYPFYSNLKYALQRLTAVGVVLFLGAHLWLAFLQPRLQERHAELYADIAQQMHFHVPTLVVYLLGTLGVSYHLANGVQTFCMGWGVVSSARALRRLDWLAIGLFFVLLGLSWAAIFALYVAGGPA